jgi:hypothetical protein
MALLASLNDALAKIWFPILNLLLALFILLLGFLVARLLGWLSVNLLKIIKLDKGLKTIGFNNLLEKGEIKKTPAELVGDLIYWAFIFITVIGLAYYFGLPIDLALTHVFSYLGLVFLAAIILGMGLFLASLLAGIVKLIALIFGIEGARPLARVIYYLVIIFAFLTALAQLGVKVEVIGEKLDVIVGAIGLAAAIAFGLGCKDMAADFLHNLFKGK